MNEPILTISIPTFNRAHLLIDLLKVLIKQVNDLEDSSLVEIVVSDNDSEDNTRAVVETLQKECASLKYFKNDTNIGGNSNLLKGPYEYAIGKYCLILGDDDLLRNNALREITSYLKNVDLDIIYLNQTYEDIKDRDNLRLDTYDEENSLCKNFKNELLDNAQAIVDFSPKYPSLFTSVSSLIFKTSIWRERFIGYQSFKSFDTLNNTFPHSVILAESLMRKPVYYFGYPYLVFTYGAQVWLADWPYVSFIHLMQLTRVFQKYGASKSFLRKYRKGIIDTSEESYFQLLTVKNHRFGKQFNNKKFLFNYLTDATFFPLFWNVYKRLFKHRLKQLLRVK